MEGLELLDLSRFLASKDLERLAESFDPPHAAIDFFETTTVQIIRPEGRAKRISTREYFLANLKERSRYPVALVLLMDRIGKIAQVANEKGKPAEVPNDCA